MTIKFHLTINNKRIRNLETLRDNFYASDILEVYKDDRLINFLKDREHLEEGDKIAVINKELSDFELIKAIADILSVNESNIKISSEKENQVYNNKDINELEAKIDQLEKEKNDYKEQLDSSKREKQVYHIEYNKTINDLKVKIEQLDSLKRETQVCHSDYNKTIDRLEKEKNYIKLGNIEKSNINELRRLRKNI